jgi:hypothetical protein
MEQGLCENLIIFQQVKKFFSCNSKFHYRIYLCFYPDTDETSAQWPALFSQN